MSYQKLMVTPSVVSGGRRADKNSVTKVRQSLERALGSERVLVSNDILEIYSQDESGFGNFLPDLVVRVRSAQEVSQVLKEASAHGVPVTPRGGGTGRVGGALPICGGIVLSLEQMNNLIEVDSSNFLAHVESGMILERFQQSVEELSLFYPPDPSSLDACSVGGNVACNAGGPRALKYGVTSNYVLGLEVVLPNGKIFWTGRNTLKGGAGYELHKLIVGSEGTLGIITKIAFKLIAKPTRLETALVTFSDSKSAGRAATAIMRSGITPRSMEFMDRASIEAARTQSARHLPDNAGACLIVELDGFNETILDEISRVGEICEKEMALNIFLAQDEAQRRDLWSARRELSPILRDLHPCKVSEDVVIPRSKLPDAIEKFELLSSSSGIKIATFGHAGDGNIHVNVLFDDHQRSQADVVLQKVLEIAVELGGTVAGEHGTGIQKVEALRLEQSEDLLEFQYQLKRFFDPAGIMNPGKVVPAFESSVRKHQQS